MKKFTLTLLACGYLFSFNALEAALPPLYQSANEIKAILASEELGQKLTSGEVITMIKKNQSGYEIMTNHHQLQVDVIYQPSHLMGPIPFKLKFQEPQNN